MGGLLPMSPQIVAGLGIGTSSIVAMTGKPYRGSSLTGEPKGTQISILNQTRPANVCSRPSPLTR